MRDHATEKPQVSPLAVLGGALLVALAAVLLRSGGHAPRLAAWWDVVGAEPPKPFALAAAPSPVAPPPPIRARVGLQVGHWKSADLPDELASLREQTGASAAGYSEVDINLAIARQVAALLTARGITVDIIPATVPAGYRADAFIAIHCDANNDGAMRGFKLARFRDSRLPARDDALLGAITAAYGPATGAPPDSHITRAMTGYYAFNAEDFRHTVSPQTPAAIVELGFLTNAVDRAILVSQQGSVARGLADGIIAFLIAGA